MGLNIHDSRRARFTVLLAAAAVVTALVAVTTAQGALAGGGKPPAGSGGQPPCPSCPDRTPPVGGNGGGGAGGAGGSAVPAAPLVSLGSVSVANGVASLTGSVNVNAAADAARAVGSASADIQVSVNGNPVSISATGNFAASTNLAANGGIAVRAGIASAGVTYSISIPASAISGNVTAAAALGQLQTDRVTLMLPPDGFTIVDGLGIDATVRVAKLTGVAKLTLNGTDLLAKLRVGTSSSGSGTGGSGSGSGVGKPPAGTTGGGSAPVHHSCSAAVAGNAKSVKLTVAATNGASQTTTVRVQRIRSVVRIGRLTTISAFGARGIRISAITFDRSAVRRSGRLHVVVTVRDRRNYLVRDAVVMLQPASQRWTIHGSWAGMSNLVGRASFRVPVASNVLGHRLYVRVIARTPRSQTHVIASASLAACSC